MSLRPLITFLVVLVSAFNYYIDYVQFHLFSGIKSDPGHVEVYDFIIVGAGSAGSVLANRLSSSPNVRVLLLEAGGYPHPLINVPVLAPSFANQPWIDWQHKTVPQQHCCQAFRDKSVLWPRGKSLGGTSNMNYMIYMRGHPKDFDNWANVSGDQQWDYSHVLPYFKKMEDYHGNFPNPGAHSTGGPLHVESSRFDIVTKATHYWVDGFKNMGFKASDPNHYQEQGGFPFDFTTKNGARFGTYKAYLLPVLQRTNLDISIYSHATKIHFDQSKSASAYGLSYVRHGVQKFARARKEIIISGGALESPRLLMLSGIGPKEHLQQLGIQCKVNLPVGQNLQDHLFGFVGPFLLNRPISFVDERDVSLNSILEYIRNGTGPFTFPTISGGGLLSSSLETSRGGGDWPDIFYLFSPTAQSAALVADFEGLMGVPAEFLNPFFTKHAAKDSFSIGISVGRPKSKGQILLQDKNPESPLLIDPKYLSHPDDVRIMLDSAKFILDMFTKSQTFKALGAHIPTDNILTDCESHTYLSDSYFACVFKQFVSTMFHHCGTCRMGKRKGDPRAVVDSNLRVLHVSNLRVIDASIFPDVTNANINAPTIMVGEKGAELIREYWAKQYQVCLTLEHLRYGDRDSTKCYYSQLI